MIDGSAPEPSPVLALAVRTDELARRVARQIRAEVPGYRHTPVAGHDDDVRAQVDDIVGGLRSRQPATAGAIERAREIGRRRALHLVPLTDVVEAYHIAFREIWDELLRGARMASLDGKKPDALGEVALLWNWIHRLSAAVTDAHAEQTRISETTQTARRRRFVEAIAGGQHGYEQEVLAQQLGFAPDGDFVVLRISDGSTETVDRINQVLSRQDGVAHCCEYSNGAVIIAQETDSSALVAAAHDGRAGALVGVGLERRGLAGSVLSLRDAEVAHRWARPTLPDVYFRDHWLMAIVAGARPQLDVLVGPGAAIGRANPALAEAVRAYVESGYSISASARLMGIHANTAKYRLNRWQELTGWDVRTFQGLASSLICLTLPVVDDSMT
jgi:hypothetical protein